MPSVTALQTATGVRLRFAGGDPASGVARAVVVEEGALDAVLPLMNDPEPLVRRQLVFSLGASTLPDAHAAMLAMLQRDGDVPFMVDAALSGLAGREAVVLDRIVARGEWAAERPGSRKLFAALATAVTNEGVPDRLERVIRHVIDPAQPLWRRHAVLSGMEAAERKALAERPPSFGRLRDVDHPELREKALAVSGRFESDGGESKPTVRQTRRRNTSRALRIRRSPRRGT